MRNLVAQIAVSNCYTDVKMVFLYDEGEEELGLGVHEMVPPCLV